MATENLIIGLTNWNTLTLLTLKFNIKIVEIDDKLSQISINNDNLKSLKLIDCENLKGKCLNSLNKIFLEELFLICAESLIKIYLTNNMPYFENLKTFELFDYEDRNLNDLDEIIGKSYNLKTWNLDLSFQENLTIDSVASLKNLELLTMNGINKLINEENFFQNLYKLEKLKVLG